MGGWVRIHLRWELVGKTDEGNSQNNTVGYHHSHEHQKLLGAKYKPKPSPNSQPYSPSISTTTTVAAIAVADPPTIQHHLGAVTNVDVTLSFQHTHHFPVFVP
ncbi:hypothetical protein L6452_13366 [Arctium lappa]|uniref:Uncharacterized protein n=1 Tax=Arctium lappa TaxID=4217 RepID=A0ACB9CID1_ARCLA|nr:hypothetical protein L6452_13366 [Arctium lappa]